MPEKFRPSLHASSPGTGYGTLFAWCQCLRLAYMYTYLTNIRNASGVSSHYS